MSITNEAATFTLSAAQREIWLSEKIAPESLLQNIAEYIEIHGPIDPKHFDASVRQLVLEAEALRVRFDESLDAPRQIIAPLPEETLFFLDVSAESDPERSAVNWMQADLIRPVELSHGPLFTFALFKITVRRFFFYMRCHHIAGDGFSALLLARRVANIYTALANHLPIPDGSFGALRYLLDADSDYRSSPKFISDRDYWLRVLAGPPDVATLSTRPFAHCQKFIRETVYLDSTDTNRLRSLGNRAQASLPQVIAALVAAYLHRLTGARDIILGLAATGRFGKAAQNTPAAVANVLPLRVALHPAMSLSDLSDSVGRDMRKALRHQRYRVEDLRRDLAFAKDQKLFGPVVNVMNFNYDLRFSGHRTTSHNLSNGPVEDLSIVVYDRSDGTGLRIDFNANSLRYRRDEIANHQQRFLKLLASYLKDSQNAVGRVNLLSGEERQSLEGWRWQDRKIPAATIPQLFQEQVEKSPTAVAVSLGDKSVSFLELDRLSSRLAQHLAGFALEQENVIALAMDRSVEFVVSILAILKAGCAYLPVDLSYPARRIRSMLEDSQAKILLTTSDRQSRFSEFGITVVVLDDLTQNSGTQSRSHEDIRLRNLGSPSDVVYVMYTSGSTGSPKGIAVPHEAVIRLIRNADYVELRPGDRVAQVANTSFDAATFEIWGALLNGGSLIILPRDVTLSPPVFEAALKEHGVDVMFLTTAMFNRMACEAPGAFSRVRDLLFGGEAADPKSVRQVLTAQTCPKRLLNVYGPTENTTFSTWHRVMSVAEGDTTIPIGRGIGNTGVYVLDEGLEMVPIGVAGELYVSGKDWRGDIGIGGG